MVTFDIGTGAPERTVQTKIRLLPMVQSDHALHCFPVCHDLSYERPVDNNYKTRIQSFE